MDSCFETNYIIKQNCPIVDYTFLLILKQINAWQTDNNKLYYMYKELDV